MSDIRKLTEEYVAAFNACDLDKVASHFAADFKLTDPDVTALTPKNEVIKYIKKLFSSHDTLRFEASSIIVDGHKSVIHFSLTLGTLVLDGVDIIDWEFSKMKSMHAYLTPRN